MAKIITIATPKGGVGKSTIGYHLAKLFKEKGTTLFVDIDSQGNSTKYILGAKRKLADKNNVVHLFRKENIEPLAIDKNFFLIGSNLLLTEFDSKTELNFFFSLQKYLKGVRKNYDYIIIDTPPNLGLFTINALLATKYVISPLDPSEDAFDGLGILLDTVNEVKEDHNDNIELLGFVLNCYDRRNKAEQAIEERVKSKYPEILFNSTIPRATKIRDARLSYQSVFELDPKSREKVTIALKELFCEIIKRFGEK